jgi:hypothetical protein
LCLLRYAPQPQQRHEYSRRIGFLKTYKVGLSGPGEGFRFRILPTFE